MFYVNQITYMLFTGWESVYLCFDGPGWFMPGEEGGGPGGALYTTVTEMTDVISRNFENDP
jgi:hypothetical protein